MPSKKTSARAGRKSVLFGFRPIGLVHSPFKSIGDIPRSRNTEARGFQNVEGEIEIYRPFSRGLRNIDGFSHLIIIFVFHDSGRRKLIVHPPSSAKPRGVFSTRSPHRPNPVGMTVVKLKERKGRFLKVSGLDMTEGTPVLDIKPYTARDRKTRIRRGWQEKN
jgi:tRNA-Thr(GGU) m(6)t(6)A37 methyltransferase TsaA